MIDDKDLKTLSKVFDDDDKKKNSIGPMTDEKFRSLLSGLKKQDSDIYRKTGLTDMLDQGFGETMIGDKNSWTTLNKNTWNKNTVISNVAIKQEVISKPFVFDDMVDSGNTRFSEKFPEFKFASLLDDVLGDFGGILEIIKVEWDGIIQENEVVCLMKDWRVFNIKMRDVDYINLGYDDQKLKVNHTCIIHEDMDDWGRWEDKREARAEVDKMKLAKKKEEEKGQVYKKHYNDALSNFFNGGIDDIRKMMVSDSDVVEVEGEKV